jgi:hypothetical protein
VSRFTPPPFLLFKTDQLFKIVQVLGTDAVGAAEAGEILNVLHSRAGSSPNDGGGLSSKGSLAQEVGTNDRNAVDLLRRLLSFYPRTRVFEMI